MGDDFVALVGLQAGEPSREILVKLDIPFHGPPLLLARNIFRLRNGVKAEGQTETQVVAVMRSLLGRPRANLQDAASLAGALDDARVTAAVISRHGRRIIGVVAESPLLRIEVLLSTRSDG